MSGSERLVIGTRGSALARWQAEHVAGLLRAAHPGLVVELSIIVTEGDRFQSAPAPVPTAGKAVWVKDIEVALLERRVDLAVHSLKDVPAELAPGPGAGGDPQRAPTPATPWSAAWAERWPACRPGARVGTSSLRRVCQTRALRPDLKLEILRGNVDTRLRKVSEGVVDAALLACAGLDRLGFGARIAERLDPEAMLPAIGQGALALEARADDDAGARPGARRCRTPRRRRRWPPSARCWPAWAAAATPRWRATRRSRRPTACWCARWSAARTRSEILRERVEGAAGDAAALGGELARRLLARGAEKILAELG